MSLTFKRYFTKENIHPYTEVEWKQTTAKIENKKDPSKSFIQENVEFPDFYSDNAINIISEKYFAGKLGTPEREYSLKQPIDRVVGTNIQWGFQQGYFGEEGFEDYPDKYRGVVEYNPEIVSYILSSNEQARIFSDELKFMLLHQMFSFNSPVWFNVGNPARKGKYQISACFINSAEDNMEHILENAEVEGQIFRYGSGAGANRSKLRSSRERITGGGFSSGPCSFMQIYDAVAKVTKSGGLTRRAAKMEILNTDHGDIKKFIWQKKKEEDKAKALIAAGWNNRFDDPDGAYGSVFFQNSNQSVRVSDAFMYAVKRDEDWALLERQPDKDPEAIWPLDPLDKDYQKKYHLDIKETSQGTFLLNWYYFDYLITDKGYFKVIEWTKAKNLFNEMTQCAWETGDPGIQFHDIINKWHTCKNDSEIEASNPCSEYMFLDDTSCNLGSFRLTRFLDFNGKFNIEAFQHAVRLVTTAMDIWIDNAVYPTEKIAQETKKYRTLGLGYTDLGALLMLKGYAYDSDEGRNYAAAITALMHATAYNQSAELAKYLGSFDEYEKNQSSVNSVLSLHSINILKNLTESDKIFSAALKQIAEIKKTGIDDHYLPVRNAQVTVIAPTGTISFMMDCDTTGIEPMLGLVQYKSLVGGGTIKIVPQCVRQALHNLNYINTDTIITAITEHGRSIAEFIKPSDLNVFATSFGSENIIPYEAHIKMMAAVQPFLSGAISKTVNMPNNATIEDVKNAYMDAWKSGLKAIAIYRDGCKSSQPLNVEDKKKKKEQQPVKTIEKSVEHSNSETMLSNGRPKPQRKKLTDTRESITHKFDIAGHQGYFTIGLYDDGQPGEIFVNVSKEGSTIRGMMDSWAIMVSMLLQYGAPIRDVIEKLKNVKFDPAGITQNPSIRFCTSIVDYIGKWLEHEFIDDDTDYVTLEGSNINNAVIKNSTANKQDFSGPPCDVCGHLTQVAGKCYVCPNCGNTTGCG